jgi:hypothetical protein
MTQIIANKRRRYILLDTGAEDLEAGGRRLEVEANKMPRDIGTNSKFVSVRFRHLTCSLSRRRFCFPCGFQLFA